MRIQRQAITAAALLAVVFAPKTAVAQRAAARVPNFIVVSFRSPGEPKLGIETAEAIRQRMLRFFPMPPLKTLRIIKQEEINGALTGSGYPADSVITTTDLRDLSKQIGAEEAMEGSVKRTAQGVEARARFYLNSNVAAPEVLPVVIEKDASAAGRKIAELYVQARKELPAYERCKNALIQNQPEQAIVAANEAQKEFPQGVLPRACLLTAYQKQFEAKKMPIDSVMRVANEIIQIDPENEIAIGQLVDAYRARGDTAQAVAMSMRLFRLNPTNTTTAISIIDFLGAVGAPDSALVVTASVMTNNPGDAALIEKQWKLFQLKNDWKRAIAAGEEMVKFDTARADTAYFRRQIGAALQDSQPQLALQFLARVTAKFPRDVALLQAYSQELRKQGQLQQALDVSKKVVAVDPKTPQAYASVISLYTQVGQPDSAVAFAKNGLVGADSSTKTQIGQGLLALIGPALTKAQSDTTSPPDVQKANWQQVLGLSAAVDSIVPSPNTAFYMSIAAFYVAQHGLANLTEVAKTNRPQACTMLKEATDNLLIVDLNMSRGGRVDPRTAGALLQATSGMKPGIESAKKQLACK